eukprot:1104729_1
MFGVESWQSSLYTTPNHYQFLRSEYRASYDICQAFRQDLMCVLIGILWVVFIANLDPNDIDVHRQSRFQSIEQIGTIKHKHLCFNSNLLATFWVFYRRIPCGVAMIERTHSFVETAPDLAMYFQ